MNAPPFHLAIAVDNLDQARDFYCNVLDCSVGRSSDHWIDFNLCGHQLVAHLIEGDSIHPQVQPDHNPVDSHQVPIPHFGLVLAWQDWHQLADRLRELEVEFIIEPYIRFAGEPGEQATMFLCDPAGNALEFKSFRNPEMLFAR